MNTMRLYKLLLTVNRWVIALLKWFGVGMSTAYKVEKKIQLIPKEVNTLSDGVDTIYTIDSNIDTTIGGSFEATLNPNVQYGDTITGTAPQFGRYYGTANITNTTKNVLGLALGLTDFHYVSKIYIKAIAKLSTGDPIIQLTYDDAVVDIVLSATTGVNDFFLIDNVELPNENLWLRALTSTTTGTIEFYIEGRKTV